MNSLIVEKHFNQYIRNDLNMSVSNKLRSHLESKLKNILNEAKQRAKLDNKKTILPRHI